MNEIIQSIRNWAEVWALLIPISVLLFWGRPGGYIRPLVLYVFVAFPICLALTVMFVFYHQMPAGLKNNNVLYNLHSVVRVLFFSLFMIGIQKDRFVAVIKYVLIAYFIAVIVNFSMLQSPFMFSSRLFVTESILLILMSILYFVRVAQDESETNWTHHPSLLVVAGFIFYEAVNFFTWLYYQPLSERTPIFGRATWTVHHITFVILCIMLALAFRKTVNRVIQIHAGR